MIDCILGAAVGYTAEQIRPFLKSLSLSGYTGTCLVFCDGETAEEVFRWGFDPLQPGPSVTKHPHSNRFFWIRDNIPADCEGALCLDTRDTVFQMNPESLPTEGLQVFEEAEFMSIGSCPYNSKWIKVGYGDAVLQQIQSAAILCVGSFCGEREAVQQYLGLLCDEIQLLQPRTNEYQDQAAHNYLCWAAPHGPPNWDSWRNEESPIYTVGYLQRGTVQIAHGNIVNRSGQVPAIIHQWDRHDNLKGLVHDRYQ